ncbi:Protein SMG8 [Aphelenchoides fujianensis]|nr:Protein SMG8 [Aphelenchoides fujianensis]
MAEKFARWLQKTADEFGIGAAEKPVLVVGVTGKSPSGTSGSLFLNEVLDRSVFCGTFEAEIEFVDISAYYSEYHQILFLYLHSYQDGAIQAKIFNSGKPFFEVLRTAESAFVRYLFVLFVLSHLVIFVQPDIRIDTTLVRHLMSVNEMRTQRRPQLMKKLEKLPAFSASWRAEGRLALPRLRVFRGDLLYTEVKPFLDARMNMLAYSDNDMSVTRFLLGHVKDVVENESEAALRTFISGAQVVWEAATGDEVYDQELVARWLSEELHFIDDHASQIAYYAYELYNQLAMDEKVGPMFFDPKLTESRHYRTLQYVAAFMRTTLTGAQLEAAWPGVLQQCNSRFKSRQNRCTAKSISGAQCCLLVHREPAQFTPGQPMEEALKGRMFQHCSGFSYVSTCNCGRTQKKRADPFNTKEANYDFYTGFTCCSKVETLPFRLYNPGIKWDVSRSTSVVVRKPDRTPQRLRVLSRTSKEGGPSSLEAERERFTTYTVTKPKPQSRIVNELLWQFNKMMHEHSGKFLQCMPHSSLQDHELTPLFPSWSVGCIGPAKLYVHVKGLHDYAGFYRGSEFLLPWDLLLTVNTNAWHKGMKEIGGPDRQPFKERRVERNVQEKTHKEKLKFFVGFEYECPKGHRFMCERPNKMLLHDRTKGTVKTDASEMITSNLPLFMPCKCSNVQRPVDAQLMRLYVCTPKAPVCVKLNPLVMLDDTGCFHLGRTAELQWNRFYVLRFPFVYEGPKGIVRKAADAATAGSLLANCLQVYQKV